MKVKLNKHVFEYLKECLSLEKSDLIQSFSFKEGERKTVIEVNDDIACEIRDWADDRLLKVGFDQDYELTKEGQILQDIVDIFYS